MTDQVYAVRTSEDFATQAEAAFDWLEQKTDFDTAEEWRVGLQEAKGSLATLPARCVVADEDKFFQKNYPGPSLQVLLYRRGRTTWRLLLTVHEATADDPAYVMLQQLRHGAQKPLKKWPSPGKS